MSEKIGYARVSTAGQDLEAQCGALVELGVTPERIHVDHGFSGSVHGPTDPVGRLLFTVLSMIAELETDLIRTRTREGMAVARAEGHSKGKKPKLSPACESELGEKFSITRSTLYRALARAGVSPRNSAASRRSAAAARGKPER